MEDPANAIKKIIYEYHAKFIFGGSLSGRVEVDDAPAKPSVFSVLLRGSQSKWLDPDFKRGFSFFPFRINEAASELEYARNNGYSTRPGKIKKLIYDEGASHEDKYGVYFYDSEYQAIWEFSFE